MDREHIESELEQLLTNFSGQFTRARNYKNIPLIELDLMIQTIRNLYEQLHKLTLVTPLVEKKKAVPAPQVVEEKNVAAENIVHAIISEADNSLTDQEAVIEEIPVVPENNILKQEQELAQVAVSIQRESVFVEQTRIQAKPVASLFDDVLTIADNYKEQHSLHHKIGKTKTERLSDKLNQEPVVDLKRSIGINEKFAFMNELFGGNQEQYNQSIDILNSFSDFENANSHLQELASNRKWNVTSTAYNELSELVKRRFGV